jgi:hypothetical protein
MGFGGSNKVKPTAEEYALMEIAAKDWNRFVEQDIPVQNEAIARMTGLRRNDDGAYEIDPNGPLRADGSIKTSGTSSQAANEAAYTSHLTRVDPNRIGATKTLNRDAAIQGASAQINEEIGQQTAVLQGEQNVVAMGRGEQQQAIQGQSYLAQQAQRDAINSANTAAQESASRSSLAGQLAGAGTAIGLHRGGYLDPKSNGANPPPNTNAAGGSMLATRFKEPIY